MGLLVVSGQVLLDATLWVGTQGQEVTEIRSSEGATLEV